jgi:hypothetical protein
MHKLKHLKIVRTGQRPGSQHRHQKMFCDKQTIRNFYEDFEIDVGTQKPL